MNTKLLLDNLRNIPDFPKPGIHFKDVSTLFKNPECIHEMLNELVRLYQDKGITKVVGIESRGFVMGAMLAEKLNAGFVMARKPGKLPAETRKATYLKEYGYDTIEIHTDAINENDVVLIHDGLRFGATFRTEKNVHQLPHRTADGGTRRTQIPGQGSRHNYPAHHH